MFFKTRFIPTHTHNFLTQVLMDEEEKTATEAAAKAEEKLLANEYYVGWDKESLQCWRCEHVPASFSEVEFAVRINIDDANDDDCVLAEFADGWRGPVHSRTVGAHKAYLASLSQASTSRSPTLLATVGKYVLKHKKDRGLLILIMCGDKQVCQVKQSCFPTEVEAIDIMSKVAAEMEKQPDEDPYSLRNHVMAEAGYVLPARGPPPAKRPAQVKRDAAISTEAADSKKQKSQNDVDEHVEAAPKPGTAASAPKTPPGRVDKTKIINMGGETSLKPESVDLISPKGNTKEDNIDDCEANKSMIAHTHTKHDHT